MPNFEDFKLNKQLLQAIEALGYQEPSPIQNKAIPLAMAGHDVMGVAQTGTGKTAAFVLPILMKLKYAQGFLPRALILAPTRELAIQIDKAIAELSQFTDLRHTVLYGGVGTKTQIEALEAGLDIITATPGRLMNLYLDEHLMFKELNTLVLDEADKMMDMGFMPQIRKLLEVIPVKRQNLLFSATMPEKVVKLSEEFLEYPMVVEVSPQATTAETVNQVKYALPNLRTKVSLLEMLLKDTEKFYRVIVFTRSRQNANNVYKYLCRKAEEEENIRVIHANKGQNTRLNAMEDFKEGKIRILVSTDVAARGIDATMVSHVINFDVPILYEEYVHRIGRTGRAKQSGEAITFYNEAEEYHLKKIEKLINMPIPEIPLPPNLEMFSTPFEEAQAIAKDIDNQKRKDNPDFKGAFHEKKAKNTPPRPRSKTNKSNKKFTGKKPSKPTFKKKGR
jgi:ATP-dependent RNA helicase RhlE